MENLFEDENLTFNWFVKEFLHATHDVKPTLKMNRKKQKLRFLNSDTATRLRSFIIWVYDICLLGCQYSI